MGDIIKVVLKKANFTEMVAFNMPIRLAIIKGNLSMINMKVRVKENMQMVITILVTLVITSNMVKEN